MAYTHAGKRFCSVFKSTRRKEMYVYVDRKDGSDAIPEDLLRFFGEPVHVLDLILTAEKKLARVKAEKVLSEIEDKGYFLQMPPTEQEDIAGDVAAPKDTLNG